MRAALASQGGLGPSPAILTPGEWRPGALGSSLRAYFDAEDSATLMLNGSAVTEWLDKVTGYSVWQDFGANRPVYSATSFNNRPGLTFDGTDDFLELVIDGATNLPGFPVGAQHGEIWALATQPLPAATTGGKIIAGYAGGANSNRRVGRTVVSGVNRAILTCGRSGGITSITNPTADYSGTHVLRGIFSPDGVAVHVEDTGMAETALVPTSNAFAFYIASNSGTQQFMPTTLNALLITGELTAGQATSLMNFLKARGGIA